MSLVLLGAFGVLYLVFPRFMPYHAAALGSSWADLAPPYRSLILALMKSAGAGLLGSAIAGGFVLFIPFRAGSSWARWAMLIVAIIVTVPTAYAMLLVKFTTPGSPPWYAPVVGLLLVLAGLALSLDGSLQRNRAGQRLPGSDRDSSGV
jgi:hypothetical protein